MSATKMNQKLQEWVFTINYCDEATVEKLKIWFTSDGWLIKCEAEEVMTSGKWDRNLMEKSIWIWGPPGTGKSRWANTQTTNENINCKLINKWWDSYDAWNHHIVIMEDYRIDGKHLIQKMKLLAMRYVFIGETKGSHELNDPGRWLFIVSANYQIEEVLEGEDFRILQLPFTKVGVEINQDIYLSSVLDLSILKGS